MFGQITIMCIVNGKHRVDENHALHTVHTANSKWPSLKFASMGMCASNTKIATTHINKLNTTKTKIIHLPKSCSCTRLKMCLLLVRHNFCKVNSKYSHTDTFQANSNCIAHIQSVKRLSNTNDKAVSTKLPKKYGHYTMALHQWRYPNILASTMKTSGL